MDETWDEHLQAIKTMVERHGLEVGDDEFREAEGDEDEDDYEEAEGEVEIKKDGEVIGSIKWVPAHGPAAEWVATSGEWCGHDQSNPQDALKELLAYHSGKTAKVKEKAAKASATGKPKKAGTTGKETMSEEHLEAAKALAKVAKQKKVSIRLDLAEDTKAGEIVSIPLADILLSLGSPAAKPLRVMVMSPAKSAPRKSAKPKKKVVRNYSRIRNA